MKSMYTAGLTVGAVVFAATLVNIEPLSGQAAGQAPGAGRGQGQGQGRGQGQGPGGAPGAGQGGRVGLQEVEAGRRFVGGRRAAEDALESGFDESISSVIAFAFHFRRQRLGKLARLGQAQRAVGQGQGLLRGDAFAAAVAFDRVGAVSLWLQADCGVAHRGRSRCREGAASQDGRHGTVSPA